MSVGIWIAARDLDGHVVVLRSMKSHLLDLPESLVTLDDDEARVIGLDEVGRQFTRATNGRPFRFSEALAGDPSPLISRLADATTLSVDAKTVDEIGPTALGAPSSDIALALRKEVDSVFLAAVRRTQPPDSEPTQAVQPPAQTSSTHVPTDEEIQQAETLRGQTQLMQLCLHETHRIILSERYGLDDGVIRSREEVAALTGRCSERIRQTVREALIRIQEAGTQGDS